MYLPAGKIFSRLENFVATSIALHNIEATYKIFFREKIGSVAPYELL